MKNILNDNNIFHPFILWFDPENRILLLGERVKH